ncbi:Uu.00g103920.m01.CDS01 [Anthostomella pinea]|uniref:Uu.00g103920.m01.CDS01 n=1 Tax=Anthostomella pinea TaxID=933095 RepID=A0AAI8YFJ7_9PEZI|nr:Uu.00g103920.m01.CDS01 [Anthostomella pinea]
MPAQTESSTTLKQAEVEAIIQHASNGELEAMQRKIRDAAENLNTSVFSMITNHVVDAGGQTVMHHAAANGRTNILNFVRRNGASREEKDKRGWTAVHTAFAEERLGAAMWLIQQGADVDATTNQGNTALHLVAKRDWFQGCEALLKANCNATVHNMNGVQAWHVADLNGNDAVSAALMEKGLGFMVPYPDYDWHAIEDETNEYYE